MTRTARFGLPFPLRQDMIGSKGVIGMKTTAPVNDYQRIEKAILFLEKNALRRPDLRK